MKMIVFFADDIYTEMFEFAQHALTFVVHETINSHIITIR